MFKKLLCSAAISTDDVPKTRKDPNDSEATFKRVPLWGFLGILAVVALVGMVAEFLDCGAFVCRFWITHIKEF
jgi:hypothetical protein